MAMSAPGRTAGPRMRAAKALTGLFVTERQHPRLHGQPAGTLACWHPSGITHDPKYARDRLAVLAAQRQHWCELERRRVAANEFCVAHKLPNRSSSGRHADKKAPDVPLMPPLRSLAQTATKVPGVLALSSAMSGELIVGARCSPAVFNYRQPVFINPVRDKAAPVGPVAPSFKVIRLQSAHSH
jgi:hypothetical protein